MGKFVGEKEYNEMEKTSTREFEDDETVRVCVFCQGLADPDTFGSGEPSRIYDDVEDEPMRDLGLV